jgi:hypothetical protein
MGRGVSDMSHVIRRLEVKPGSACPIVLPVDETAFHLCHLCNTDSTSGFTLSKRLQRRASLFRRFDPN